MLFYRSCPFVNGDVMLLSLFLMYLVCCGRDHSVIVVLDVLDVLFFCSLIEKCPSRRGECFKAPC